MGIGEKVVMGMISFAFLVVGIPSFILSCVEGSYDAAIGSACFVGLGCLGFACIKEQ